MQPKTTEYRAGGIVCRKHNDQIEYLFVTSNSNKERWIIPAGHIELGETAIDAATREVLEEAGVNAEAILDLGSIKYDWYRNRQWIVIDTALYLMRYIDTVTQNPEGRQVAFFSYEQVEQLNLWDETREIIKQVNQRLLENKEQLQF